jgi:hypothetical protein
MQECIKSGQSTRHIRSNRVMLAYVFGDYELAAKCMRPSFLDFGMPPIVQALYSVFFEGMTALALVERGTNRRSNLRLARRIIKKMKQGSALTPHTFLGKEYLLKAERDSVLGKTGNATKRYICAIGVARESGIRLDHALSNERAGRHYVRLGESDAAESYFRAAYASYVCWGAKAKASQLLSEINAMHCR